LLFWFVRPLFGCAFVLSSSAVFAVPKFSVSLRSRSLSLKHCRMATAARESLS
jgi:hypothetical protein